MKINLYVQFLNVFFMIYEVTTSNPEDKPADPGQLPYMAQIVRVIDTNTTYSVFGSACGASLISPQWVLTAGKCFPWSEDEIKDIAKNNSMVVVMGSINNLDFSTSSSRRFIIKIVRHPDYQHVIAGDMEVVSDDIALAEVKNGFYLNRYIQTVELSSPIYLSGVDIVKHIDTCIVMGFGRPTKGNQKTTKKSSLIYSSVHLVSSLKFQIPLTSNVFVSTSSPDNNKSHGDLGAPVMCVGLQFGVVSSLALIDEVYVDMYTDVGRYQEFILKHVPEAKFQVPNVRTRAKSNQIYGQIQIIIGIGVFVYCVNYS